MLASGCRPPPPHELALNSFTPGVKGDRRVISMPSLPAHLFRGHQVLGDNAPELPPGPAQQSALDNPSPICLSLGTRLDRPQVTQTEDGPELSTQSILLRSPQTPTKEAQVRIDP